MTAQQIKLLKKYNAIVKFCDDATLQQIIDETLKGK